MRRCFKSSLPAVASADSLTILAAGDGAGVGGSKFRPWRGGATGCRPWKTLKRAGQNFASTEPAAVAAAASPEATEVSSPARLMVAALRTAAEQGVQTGLADLANTCWK